MCRHDVCRPQQHATTASLSCLGLLSGGGHVVVCASPKGWHPSFPGSPSRVAGMWACACIPRCQQHRVRVGHSRHRMHTMWGSRYALCPGPLLPVRAPSPVAAVWVLLVPGACSCCFGCAPGMRWHVAGSRANQPNRGSQQRAPLCCCGLWNTRWHCHDTFSTLTGVLYTRAELHRT